MSSLRLSDIAKWTRGQLNAQALAAPDLAVMGISTDTRTLKNGELFIALHGERFDAHEFLDNARKLGAAAVLVTRPVDMDLPQIAVADTELALGAIAKAVRTNRSTRVIGITGSNGKTTVKTLTSSILRLAGRTHVNAGNLNNEIGLPLSLLAEPADTEFGVYEMGAGKPGDIAYLAAIAQPQIGLVNNIAPAHLERMGSVQGVAETKAALYAALPADGIAVINADDAFAAYFTKISGTRRIIRFGLNNPAEVTAKQIELVPETRFILHTPLGEIPVILPLSGRHNVENALAAAAIACALDIPLNEIQAGLAAAKAVNGRGVRHCGASGWVLIDDSYNANPGSTAAAIATLALEPGETWLVLGDMRELGPDAKRLHADIGALAKAKGIARLYAVGELSLAAVSSFGSGGAHFADQAALIAALKPALHSDVHCLVKGSRGSAMERVVAALLDADGTYQGDQHAA